MISRSIRTALALVAAPLFLGSCSLLDSLSETANIFSVKFSSGVPAYIGPTISGPSITQAGIDYLIHDANYVLGEYSLVITFRVVGDNRGNKGTASFGQHVQPQLNLYVDTKANRPFKANIAPFSIDSGAVDTLQFPISVPLTTVRDMGPGVIDKILNGQSIPYYLTGQLNFQIVQGLTLMGDGSTEVDLATGSIPTRPSGSFSLSDLTQFL